MRLMVSPDLQPNHFIFQGHCERFNPNVNPKSSDSDLRFSNGIHSVLFPLHFKSFIVLIFPLPLFSLHLFSLPAYTSAFLVVPYGLWFADSAARQRSWKVTWDKSCFSALRADIFQLCSALLPSDSPNMLAGGLGGGGGHTGGLEDGTLGLHVPQWLWWKQLYHVKKLRPCMMRRDTVLVVSIWL